MESTERQKKDLNTYVSPVIDSLREELEDDDVSMKRQEKELSLKKPLTFGLFHLASENHDSLRVALTLAEFSLQSYEKVYLVFSPLHEEKILPQLENWGFEDPSFLNRDTLWDKAHRVGVTKVSDSQFVSLVNDNRSLAHLNVSKQSFDGSLVLFDGSSFGIRFLDSLGELLNVLFVVSEKQIVDLIESYQMLKSFWLLNPQIQTEFFLMAQEIEETFQLVQKEFQSIVRKHLQMKLFCHPFLTNRLLSVDKPSSLRENGVFAGHHFSPPEKDERCDALRRFVFEKILYKG